jgi:hypothetical protein
VRTSPSIAPNGVENSWKSISGAAEVASSPVLVTATDVHFRKIATQSCCTWRKLLQKRFWQQEANFWHEASSTIFDPPLREDGQFSFHLSLDKPKRPALAGR